MLSIYICEDQKAELDYITECVKDYVLFHCKDISPCIRTFQSPYKLLDEVQSKHELAIYLLDIDLRTDITGIETAKEIRNYDPRGFIIFITTHSELAPTTFQYQVEALNYIVKDKGNLREQIFHTLQQAFERYAHFRQLDTAAPKRQIQIKIGTNLYYMKETDIMYIAESEHQQRLCLHTRDSVMEFYGSLKDIKEQLSAEDFFQCHRSAIINLQYIKDIDFRNKKIIMRDGKTFSISQHKVSLFRKTLESRTQNK